MSRPRVLMAALVLAAAPAAGRADEKLAGVACRSVHLRYPAAAGTAFYNELTVRESAPGTYFMACGWDKGYFGIQEQGGGKKVAIFSVWDSGQNDPNAVADAERVKVLYADPAVRAKRFGGEGSGGQSFLDLDWKVGETYRFLVTAAAAGDRTEYTGFLAGPGGPWRRLVTFSTITGGKPLKGYYSFVEDFKRDRVSLTKPRSAAFGGGWVREAAGGRWVPLDVAQFTADANPATNIDAGAKDGRFYMATGGDTANAGTKLRGEMRLPTRAATAPPEGLPAAPPAGPGR